MAYSIFMYARYTTSREDMNRRCSLVLEDLTIEITRKCPLNCLMCSSYGGIPYPNELTLDELKRIIDDAHGLGTQTIIFSGGEPFEHPHLIDLCEHAKRYDLGVCIYTSGNVRSEDYSIKPIGESLLSYLKKISINKMIFGLQGPNAEVHESITGVKGSFTNTIISIRRVVRESIPTEIHFVPVKLNYRTLPRMIMLAKKLQVDKISVLRFVMQGRGEANNKMLSLDPHELLALKLILREMLASKTPRVRIGAPFNAFGLSEENYCTIGKSRATIRADGFVFPCEAMKELPYCLDNNLRRRSLKEVWEESKIFREARAFASIISRSLCRNCKEFAQCKGGCPAQRLLSGASIMDHVDPYCLTIEVTTRNA